MDHKIILVEELAAQGDRQAILEMSEYYIYQKILIFQLKKVSLY